MNRGIARKRSFKNVHPWDWHSRTCASFLSKLWELILLGSGKMWALTAWATQFSEPSPLYFQATICAWFCLEHPATIFSNLDLILRPTTFPGCYKHLNLPTDLLLRTPNYFVFILQSPPLSQSMDSSPPSSNGPVGPNTLSPGTFLIAINISTCQEILRNDLKI